MKVQVLRQWSTSSSVKVNDISISQRKFTHHQVKLKSNSLLYLLLFRTKVHTLLSFVVVFIKLKIGLGGDEQVFYNSLCVFHNTLPKLKKARLR